MCSGYQSLGKLLLPESTVTPIFPEVKIHEFSQVSASQPDRTKPHAMTTRVVIVAQMTIDDPVAHELFDLAWRRTVEGLPAPPIVGGGPASGEEYIALIETLTDFARGLEVNLRAAVQQAASLHQVPHAAIGRACGVSRQAVRQRLAREKVADEQRRWERYERGDDYWGENYD